MLSLNRRNFLQATLGGAAGLSLCSREVFAQNGAVNSTPLADGLFLLTGAGENVVAQTGRDGVLLVDGGSAAGSDALLKAVAALPNGNGKIHTLFNTHWHPEQTGSNEKLGMAGAAIIAQENTRLWLQQNITWPWNGQKFKKFPKIAQPNKTFYDNGTLDSGVKYGYITDAAHTDGDLYVYFPKENILAVGGAVSNQGWPMVDWWTGGWIGGLVGGTQRIQTIANRETKIVPSRGPVMTYADLAAQVDMYGTLYDKLNQMINKGRGPSEAVQAKVAAEFEAKMGNSDEFIRRSAESLWAYLSPDA